MPDPSSSSSLLTAAADAAAGHRFADAAQLLRQALDQQRRILGPDHPDLAVILNNLALMLERTGDASEAGRCYEQAYQIARAALGPGDPAVQVSRANLEAFRAAAGRIAAMPAPRAAAGESWPNSETDTTASSRPVGQRQPAAEATLTPTPATHSSSALSAFPSASFPARPEPAVRAARTSRQPSRSAAAGVRPAGGGQRQWPLVAAVLGALGVAGWYLLAPGNGGLAPAPAVVSPAPDAALPPAPPVVPEGQPVTPSTSTPPAVGTPSGGQTPAPSPSRLPDASPPPRDAAAAGTRAAPLPDASPADAARLTQVADARLCLALVRSGNPWRCEDAGDAIRATDVYYYTRVRLPRDGTVRHRWSLDGRVVAERVLRIRANPGEGFRTFSRQALMRPGEWHVALLDGNGVVLDERRFRVP